MTYLTFISYASVDSEYAERLAADLEIRGARCWYASRDLPLGSDFAKEIFEAISRASRFVVLISAAADKSEHVAREIGLAAQLNCPVLPLRIDNHAPTGALCYYSRTLNMHTIRPEDYARTMDRFAEAVKLPR